MSSPALLRRGPVSVFRFPPSLRCGLISLPPAPFAIPSSLGVNMRRSRLFGQLPGRNKLKAGSRLLVSPPRNQIHPVLLWGAVKLVGSRRPVGKPGKRVAFSPASLIGDRAGAVKRGSAQPTVHLFIAPAWHGVRRPVPTPLIGRGKPVRCSPAERLMRTPQIISVKELGKAALLFYSIGRWTKLDPFVFTSTTSARRRCCRGSARVHPC